MKNRITKDHIRNVWVDRNNNTWDIRLYTKKEATIHSNTLTQCKNCHNCFNCKGCYACIDCNGCTHCEGCDNCDNCIECKQCTLCDSCFQCYRTKMSKYCNSCQMCSYCAHCTSCLWCDSCKYSSQLQKCRGCERLDTTPLHYIVCSNTDKGLSEINFYLVGDKLMVYYKGWWGMVEDTPLDTIDNHFYTELSRAENLFNCKFI